MMNYNLDELVRDFSTENLKNFFANKIRTFRAEEEDYEYLFDGKQDILNNYEDISKIGEADLEEDELIVIAAKSLKDLTNRTGKKRQYDIAKTILKEENKDGAIFVFYDQNGNFRFSFVRINYHLSKRNYTSFKRYTYYVSPKLTNKTFKIRINECNFSSLDNIQEAFSVEPLTKEFYEKLQHWYFWALENAEFPKDAEKEKNGRQVSVIRLITRIVFIWFMKVRGLVPQTLFNEDDLKNILKDLSANESTYYKAILQNLFFATLNTPQKDRKFRSEIRGYKGYNPDYGNHSVFRYQYLFKNEESIRTLFEEIPFLNGGLFECLDNKAKNSDDREYIDGFTDTKKYQPNIPNFLFFSKGRKTKEISKYFEDEKDRTVEGLINILNEYNFTIDENEIDDVEVALDPELLGSIFENLLARYNPETSTTARKATGSYYTPRNIVNYMVSESLKQYFLIHLGENFKDIIEKILNVSSNGNKEDIELSLQEKKKIIDLINDLRIVDPAVGSGAFPMAILNKLVGILNKLDKNNELWKESQIQAVEKSVTDPTVKKELIERIEQRFKEKNADYGRKLYLIEKCIYGVDIQQIAVEIAKLRFFISLLVDENIDPNKPNKGIEPLPNLDFKIMQGNSLISTFAGVDFNKKQDLNNNFLYHMKEKYYTITKEFEKLKNQYQNESDKINKHHLRKKIYNKIIEMIEEKAKQNKSKNININEIKEKLLLVNKNAKSRKFFLWNVYFAEVFNQKGGFDIVIGNPPYIKSRDKKLFPEEIKNLYQKNTKIRWSNNAKFITKGSDILIYFFELSIFILNKKGISNFITQNAWLSTDYGKKFQHFLLLNDIEIIIQDSLTKHFKDTSGPNINTIITFFIKKQKDAKVKFLIVDIDKNSNIELKKTVRTFAIEDEMLKYKWAMLLKSPPFIIKLFSSLYKIGSYKDYFVGQGLNLKKDFYINENKIKNFSFLKDNLLPIFTISDGTPYVVTKTKKYLINEKGLNETEVNIIRNSGIELFNTLSRRKIPSIILPRGIGRRYFAAFNCIKAYSSSYVEIYTHNIKIARDIWIFLNSTIGYLIREISGRTNLGGGMLKAESTDLKKFPLKYNFNVDTDKLLLSLNNKEANTIGNTVNTEIHRKIDKIVFEHLKISMADREKFINYLLLLVDERDKKSKV